VEASNRIFYSFLASPIPVWEQRRKIPASSVGGITTAYWFGVFFVQEVVQSISYNFVATVPLLPQDWDGDGYPEQLVYNWPDPPPDPLPTRFVCCVPDEFRTDGSTGYSHKWCISGYPAGITEIRPIPSYLCVLPELYTAQTDPIDGDDPASYLPSVSIYELETVPIPIPIIDETYVRGCVDNTVVVLHGDMRALPAATKLAATLMNADVCDCDFVRSNVARWKTDTLSERGLRGIPHPLIYRNPFGETKLGALEVFSQLTQLWSR